MSEWTNMHGETLRVEWEDDHAVLYHSDMDDEPVDLDVRVVGFRRGQPSELSQLDALQRPQLGDVVLSQEEQAWLLAEITRVGLKATR